ncbi:MULTISPECIES: glycosyltransferase family 4 protein [Inquilinus]|uniref:Glycosyltransferase involved in cell wall biosynthesis n=1 Tax=Inquilinus ginsengisoli TaxID=363840 RepID=A0ABU1JI10_9PROT|nr:glycosyltransferase family 4 protein [Inquilinus ginsengisoli]MDR6288245.1 glycosyltransferase involved in cell wall biosynthesis [Inquilinus ginsengisoli]
MKLAYFGFPHIGGTYSVFRHLRAGLAGAGIELRWLGCGPKAHAAADNPMFRAEMDFGRTVGRPDDGDYARTQAMVTAIETEFDGVFVNVLADRVQTNAVRYLDPRILRIMVVHNITPGTYAAARAIRDHVHATIGVSARIQADLVRRYGFHRDWTVTIPNGIDLAGSVAPRPARSQRGLRLVYLGRVEDQAKGVFWLPRICRDLPPSVTLTVAGDGPDLARLKSRCARLGGRVRFRGAVPPNLVGALLAEHDVLLMPSRYEGFPVTLVEAMGAGCVPVASHLQGVTDMAVEDGVNGFLFPVGDTRAAVQAITRLAEDRPRLATMSALAARKAREQFGVGLMAERYRDLIDGVRYSQPAVAPPLGLSGWRLPPGLRPGLRTYLPTSLKNVLRTLRERQA